MGEARARFFSYGHRIRQEAPETYTKMVELHTGLEAFLARMGLRLGREDVVYAEFAQAAEQFFELLRAIGAVWGDERPEEAPSATYSRECGG
ncbi:MAG: hypothetical protein LC808_24990, partial [Actinobacteria bacterium]|nr:hypothetical protein [Actinomycetota bacterium]